MNRDNEKLLYQRFPFYGGEDHGVYFAISDGWFKIIWALSFKIEKILESVPEKDRKAFEVAQVKEKFSSLRYYTFGGNDEIYQAIREAEIESSKTCEDCGKPGKLRRGGWLVTLCDKCAKKSRNS